MSGYRFNPPPNWPAPPQGWVPPPGWQPDPAWPAPPAGWELWVPLESTHAAYHNAWWSGSRADAGTAATIPVVMPEFSAPPMPARAPHVVPTPTAVVPEFIAPPGGFGPPPQGEDGSELERLRAWVARTHGMDAVRAQEELARLREEIEGARSAALTDAEAIRKVARDEAQRLKEEARSAEQEAAGAHEEAEESHEELERVGSRLAELRAAVTVTEEAVLLQEAGVYAYRHPLDGVVAYEAELGAVQGAIKALVKSGEAVSAGDGAGKPARDLAKLLLRAYNAEADNAVLTMRPHRLESLVGRLDALRETVAKLGAESGLTVADAYHDARVKELTLTADHLRRKDEEKDAERATRAREREEATARAKTDKELERLRKESQRCRTAIERARKKDDLEAAAEAESELADAGEKIAQLEAQAGEARAGHLYVLSNVGAFGDAVVRIGVSRRPDPLEEIAELSGPAVPFAFDVHAVVRSDDAAGLEERLRERFADEAVNRVDGTRGFYRAAPARVREALAEFAGDLLVEFTEDAAAREWRAGGGGGSPQG